MPTLARKHPLRKRSMGRHRDCASRWRPCAVSCRRSKPQFAPAAINFAAALRAMLQEPAPTRKGRSAPRIGCPRHTREEKRSTPPPRTNRERYSCRPLRCVTITTSRHAKTGRKEAGTARGGQNTPSHASRNRTLDAHVRTSRTIVLLGLRKGLIVIHVMRIARNVAVQHLIEHLLCRALFRPQAPAPHKVA